MDQTPDDYRLLVQAAEGSEASFVALYHRHRVPVFRFAWRLTGSATAAEDIVQECFLALLNGAKFDARQPSLLAYLFGITRHLAMKRMRVSERESDEPADVASPVSPLEDLLSAERSTLVQEAVSALAPLQKEALILFEYEGLSLEEIAEVTESDVGTVKARLHRARESLRRRLAPLFVPAA
jgi:RNA polymerase sigma-70 factor (ECF subfamily)